MGKPNLRSQDIERFWGKVDKKEPSECWSWTGHIIKKRGGYGEFKLLKRPYRAHRVAYLITHPEWGFNPDDKVLHSCDNPLCQNPNHLSLGTDWDNVQDMIAKGRQAKGEKSHRNTLSENQVRKIKQRLREGERPLDLAREHGVAPGTISAIKSDRCWSWVTI